MARAQTRGEEIANATSHGIACLLAVAVLPVLVHAAVQRGRAAEVVAAGVFGGTMILLFGVSTLYHALPAGTAKAWLKRLDHASIYLFIAGSYMPFLLGALRGAWGWSLFGVVWAAAALGVGVKLLNRLKHKGWSTGLYLAMGWVAVIAAVPLYERLPVAALAWLIAGGVAYSAGAAVYLLSSRLRYAHFVWHLFVIAGGSCHFLAVLAAVGVPPPDVATVDIGRLT
jgi:hemolysin III